MKPSALFRAGGKEQSGRLRGLAEGTSRGNPPSQVGAGPRVRARGKKSWERSRTCRWEEVTGDPGSDPRFGVPQLRGAEPGSRGGSAEHRSPGVLSRATGGLAGLAGRASFAGSRTWVPRWGKFLGWGPRETSPCSPGPRRLASLVAPGGGALAGAGPWCSGGEAGRGSRGRRVPRLPPRPTLSPSRIETETSPRAPFRGTKKPRLGGMGARSRGHRPPGRDLTTCVVGRLVGLGV